MIPIQRGPEPPALAIARARELVELRRLARRLRRPPVSEEITGYQVAGEALWKAQHHKCCYCEQKIKKGRNDVEHYRPKARADRAPGCPDDHGYWWLAFTWENLLFSCPACNESAKRCLFPLMRGDTALAAEEAPPGKERPLLIDPAGPIHPVKHICFEHRLSTGTDPAGLRGTMQWFARPRGRTAWGTWTIRVCRLNEPELLELRHDHVDQWVRPRADDLNAAIVRGDAVQVRREWHRARGMLTPRSEFAALSYDALRHFVSDAKLAPWNLSWPEPEQVGV